MVSISPSGEKIRSKKQSDLYLRSHPGGPSSSEFDRGFGDDTPRRSARLRERTTETDVSMKEPLKEEPSKKRVRHSVSKKTAKKKMEHEDSDVKDDAPEEKEPPKKRDRFSTLKKGAKHKNSRGSEKIVAQFVPNIETADRNDAGEDNDNDEERDTKDSEIDNLDAVVYGTEGLASWTISMNVFLASMTHMLEVLTKKIEDCRRSELGRERRSRLLIDFLKLDPPTYSGGSDPDEVELWISKMSKLFHVMGCNEDQKRILASHQLDGPAYMWWEAESARMVNPTFTWEDFQRMVRAKFVPYIVRDQLRDAFLHLKQGTMTVDSYDREFLRLSRYAPNVITSEKEKTEMFISGLRFFIRMRVVAKPITTYADAVEAALRVEKVEQEEALYGQSRRDQSKSSTSGGHYLKGRNPEKKETIACFTCGKPGHYFKNCRASAHT